MKDNQDETFFVLRGNEYENLGFWTVPKALHHFAHTLYICPKCGDIWAKTMLSNVDRYLTELRRCAEHGDGTLLRNIFNKRIEYSGLPRNLLQREARLVFAYRETYEMERTGHGR